MGSASRRTIAGKVRLKPDPTKNEDSLRHSGDELDDVAAEVDEDGDQCPDVAGDVEREPELVGIKAEKGAREDQMRGARDGEEFSCSLHDAQKRCLESRGHGQEGRT